MSFERNFKQAMRLRSAGLYKLKLSTGEYNHEDNEFFENKQQKIKIYVGLV